MEMIDNLIKLMSEKGITPYKLEKDTGIRQQTFSGWKSGHQPPIDKILIIIKYLGVSPNEIFGYETIEQLNENEKEMLQLFQQLPEREQIKQIARLEDKVKELGEQKSLDSKIG